ncbi:MAG TPA: hypothetical protein VKD08_03335 [Ignavibacteriaceae bacterium]|jgi:hypothetical protein|nr:hypothetical protein [Ignavibacteriaceae bacterium]
MEKLKQSVKTYSSSINISKYSGKLYVDPEYGKELPKVKINYAIFSSKWDIEEVAEDNILRIVHHESGDSISISFDNIMDRIEFVKNIYASKPVKQIGKGMNLEQYANLNLKPREKSIFDKLISRPAS